MLIEAYYKKLHEGKKVGGLTSLSPWGKKLGGHAPPLSITKLRPWPYMPTVFFLTMALLSNAS